MQPSAPCPTRDRRRGTRHLPGRPLSANLLLLAWLAMWLAPVVPMAQAQEAAPDADTAPALEQAVEDVIPGDEPTGEDPSTQRIDEHRVDLDQRIDELFKPVADAAMTVIFFPILWSTDEDGETHKVAFILVWLAGAGIFLTLFFKFINIRALPLAFRTIRGRYSKGDDPGEITHFQAFTSAVAATVGLGNIAGVAVAIGNGGPGAALWIILMGFLGMTTKFAECTLGVKYRRIDADGQVHGGPFYYLTEGLRERGLATLGKVLAFIFAILCVGAALGGGNMFQINQACDQFVNVTQNYLPRSNDYRWLFGLVIAIIVGMVLIGGIKRIGHVTARLVPAMCVVYLIGCFVVIGNHLGEVPAAFGKIFASALDFEAAGWGIFAAMLIGIQRAVFSNEAGIGSAPIAHAAVKTKQPASEGMVALLEPFLDTVIICTLTALVVVVTGTYEEGLAGTSGGIVMTSNAFASVIDWFPYVLSVAVILFAISTLISWSYYGNQAWNYLLGHGPRRDLAFKLMFCGFVIIGAAASLSAVIDFSDAMLLGMCFPNLIGVYLLLPVVRDEVRRYREHVRSVDTNGG